MNYFVTLEYTTTAIASPLFISPDNALIRHKDRLYLFDSA